MAQNKKEKVVLIKQAHRVLNDKSLLELLSAKEVQARKFADKGEHDCGDILGDIISLHKLAVERGLKQDD